MRKQVATLVVVSALLTGCGGAVEGSPVAADRWDPCSITPEALAATGLDPAYRVEGWGKGIEVPDWARCVFHSPGGVDYLYGLDVISSIDHTIDDARSREGNQGIRDLEVGGRDAFMYTTKTGASLSDCNIALKMSSGVAVFTVVNHSEDRVDACEKAELHVNDLESSIPSATK